MFLYWIILFQKTLSHCTTTKNFVFQENVGIGAKIIYPGHLKTKHCVKSLRSQRWDTSTRIYYKQRIDWKSKKLINFSTFGLHKSYTWIIWYPMKSERSVSEKLLLEDIRLVMDQRWIPENWSRITVWIRIQVSSWKSPCVRNQEIVHLFQLPLSRTVLQWGQGNLILIFFTNICSSDSQIFLLDYDIAGIVDWYSDAYCSIDTVTEV